MADEQHIQHTLYVNREVKVYRIPPRPHSGGHSAQGWRVDDCIFTGRLRVMATGEVGEVRLEDTSSGELFALCPFTPATQAVAIEPAVDSSRYYVLRVEDPGTRRHAFLGIGFEDRGDAFDFNAALADHAKQCKRESIVAAAAAAGDSGGAGSSSAAAAAAAAGGSNWQDPALSALYRDPGDLSLKEGQTIRIDVKRPPSNSGGGSSGFLARAAGSSGLGLRSGGSDSGAAGGSGSSGGSIPPVLPPPPAVVLPPPPVARPQGFSSTFSPPATTNKQGLPEDNWAVFD